MSAEDRLKTLLNDFKRQDDQNVPPFPAELSLNEVSPATYMDDSEAYMAPACRHKGVVSVVDSQ